MHASNQVENNQSSKIIYIETQPAQAKSKIHFDALSSQIVEPFTKNGSHQ